MMYIIMIWTNKYFIFIRILDVLNFIELHVSSSMTYRYIFFHLQATQELKNLFKDPGFVPGLCQILGSSSNAQVHVHVLLWL